MSTPKFQLQTDFNYKANSQEETAKKLCLELIKAEKEEDVIKILKEYKYWNDDSVWRDFGDNENNFSTIGGQQDKADYAVVEKIINSIDHILMGECKVRNINIEGGKEDGTPQSIKEAIIKFFEIEDGLLTNLSPTKRSSISEKVKLIATGDTYKPNYIIADQGEGQTPKNMPHTLLSINKSNKLKVPFVQGKFNMGGTGVLRFCGENRFQLILSKKNPKIQDNNDDTFNQWGFTIIRRFPATNKTRSSVYKYLAPGEEKSVLSFSANTLPILPGVYPQAYGEAMEYGTYIKLYNYNLKGYKTNILLDLYYRLSLLMPNIALPIRLYERRRRYAEGHSHEATLSGLSVRLGEERGEKNLEFSFPVQLPPCLGQNIKGQGYAFKKGKIEKYSRQEGIIFTVNGQSHGSIHKSFFDKKDVGLSYISDSILIALDCSNIDNNQKEDLFMTSRDRLNNNSPLKNEIERELKIFLKNHEGLKDLKNKRRSEVVQNKIAEDKKLEEIIQKVMKNSPTLSKLFIQGQRLSNPFNPTQHKESDEIKLKDFPDYFELTNKATEEKPKICPINNKSLRIQYRTNAKNDYFTRNVDPGKIEIFVNEKKYENYAPNIWNGYANLKINVSKDWKVDDVLKVKSVVTDISNPSKFEETFYIKIVEESQINIGSNTGKRKKPTIKEEGKTKSVGYLDMPNTKLISRNEWDQYGFEAKEDAMIVKGNLEDGYDFYINGDNIHLLTEIKGHSKISPELLKAQYKYGMVLIGLSLLRDENENNYNFKDISEITKKISPFLLPMISHLGELD